MIQWHATSLADQGVKVPVVHFAKRGGSPHQAVVGVGNAERKIAN
jgi:hypothetical protein